MAGFLGPADLAGVPDGEIVRVAGRVLDVDGVSVVLGDALGVVSARLAAAAPLCAGDLAQIEGCWRERSLVDARVLASQRPGRLDGPGDVQRLQRVGRLLAQRARMMAVVRAFFVRQGFVEVETPTLVPSPGLDLHLDGCAADGGFLITSPEYQMKRLLVGGLPRIFQVARCFRRGELGGLHNPEFTMLEWYRAFAGHEDVMDDTEALVREVAASVGAEAFLRDGRRISLAAPFVRFTVAEAFARFASVDADALVRLARDDEDTYFRLMVEQVEPGIAALDRPVFLTDFPASQASLARRKPEDPRFAERFELYAGGVELCNGFGELTDPAEQRARLEADQAERRRRGLPVYPIDERFLGALVEGMPPSGGNALGLDRLFSLAAGARTIGEVMAFPASELLAAAAVAHGKPCTNTLTTTTTTTTNDDDDDLDDDDDDDDERRTTTTTGAGAGGALRGGRRSGTFGGGSFRNLLDLSRPCARKV